MLMMAEKEGDHQDCGGGLQKKKWYALVVKPSQLGTRKAGAALPRYDLQTSDCYKD